MRRERERERERERRFGAKINIVKILPIFFKKFFGTKNKFFLSLIDEFFCQIQEIFKTTQKFVSQNTVFCLCNVQKDFSKSEFVKITNVQHWAKIVKPHKMNCLRIFGSQAVCVATHAPASCDHMHKYDIHTYI